MKANTSIPTASITNGHGKWWHDDTLPQTEEDLQNKQQGKSWDENLTIEHKLSFEEAIEMFRVITGACNHGTRFFCG